MSSTVTTSPSSGSSSLNDDERKGRVRARPFWRTRLGAASSLRSDLRRLLHLGRDECTARIVVGREPYEQVLEDLAI